LSRRSRKSRAEAAGGGAPARRAPPAGARAAGAPRRDAWAEALGRLGLAPLAALALVLCAGLILQLPALDTPFFADDYLFLDQVGRHSLAQTLAAPDPIGNYYRPVGRQLFFWLVARASGGSALVFHAVALALWLAVLGLLFAVARRIAGPLAGLIAAGMLALHFAADVPVRWASGCQDLLAVAGALGALWLHLAGRRVWAGVALLLALLSKEVVALTPFIAVVAAREPGEPWRNSVRRAWPLAAAVVAWALIVWSVTHARAATPESLTVTPVAVVAALAHLVQVACGIEWYHRVSAGDLRLPAWLASLALVLLALAGARRTGPAPSSGARAPEAGRGIAAGIVWALAGAAPIAAVASIWSAYYYLFALCGVALVLGAWLAGGPRKWALAAVAVLSWNSARSSSLPAHALVREPWATCSHVNRQYLERGTHIIQRYLRHLRAARPSVPPGSTLFFSGVPGGVAFQAGDGPLVRWAYRDTSLRSYYSNSFDLQKARRGPYFFFEVRNDSLAETADDPMRFYRMALGAILSARPTAAREFLWAQQDRDSTSAMGRYWLAWVTLELGDRDRALELLRAAGFSGLADRAPEIPAARAVLARGDTLGAWRMMQRAVSAHLLDAEAHGLLADLTFMTSREAAGGVLEAYAARLLAPDSPGAWRRWAGVQIHQERPLEGAGSLRHYFDLAGGKAAADVEAQTMAKYLRSKYPVTGAVLDRSAAP
jgi:hypothetical protein